MKNRLHAWLMKKGWKNAFMIGYKMGEKDGQQKVWLEGYEAGYNFGRNEALLSYSEGFDDGREIGRSQIIDQLTAHGG